MARALEGLYAHRAFGERLGRAAQVSGARAALWRDTTGRDPEMAGRPTPAPECARLSVSQRDSKHRHRSSPTPPRLRHLDGPGSALHSFTAFGTLGAVKGLRPPLGSCQYPDRAAARRHCPGPVGRRDPHRSGCWPRRLQAQDFRSRRGSPPPRGSNPPNARESSSSSPGRCRRPSAWRAALPDPALAGSR